MNFKKKYALIGLLILMNIVLVITMLIPPQTYAKQDDTKSQKKICSWDVAATKNENYVFLGDSITDWYPIIELYGEKAPIVNSGKAGYKTTDIIKELNELVYIYNPTKVFLLIGTNDLSSGVSTEEIVNNIKGIINKIKKHRPQAKIYVQSIYPVNKTDNKKIKKTMIGSRNNEDIKKINKELKEYCKDNNVTYIDMYQELIDKEDNLYINYTEDGLHLSTLGYVKVTKKILTYLQ